MKMSAQETILDRIKSVIQKWLNANKPPYTGRRFKDNVSEYEGPGSVVLRNKYGRITCSPFNHGIFRVYLKSVYKKDPWLERNSWTIDLANVNQDGWRFQRTNDTAEFIYTFPDGFEAHLKCMESRGTIFCQLGSELVLVEPFPPQSTRKWLLVKKHLFRPGEVRVFGLGENTPPMNKAGQTIVMWNLDPLIYEIGTTPLYQSWPVVIFQYVDGPALGLVFDNPGYAVFKFSADGKTMTYAVRDTELSYFILLGPTLPEIMRQLALLTGKLPPLPKWALGYQQSRELYSLLPRSRNCGNV